MIEDGHKGELSVDQNQIVIKAATIVVTISGALAFIVISFIGDTWDSIPHINKKDAFVLLNAAGAHFILSFSFAVPIIALEHFVNIKKLKISCFLGCGLYIYTALILQHNQLSIIMLSQPWESVFLLAKQMTNAAQKSETLLYFLPLICAWCGTGLVTLTMLLFRSGVLKLREGQK